MATQGRDDTSARERDERGRFTETVSDQTILKTFDFETSDEDPFLTASECRDALLAHFDVDITTEAVRARLESMCDDETIARREFGASVAYRALMAPALSSTRSGRSDRRQRQASDEFVEL